MIACATQDGWVRSVTSPALLATLALDVRKSVSVLEMSSATPRTARYGVLLVCLLFCIHAYQSCSAIARQDFLDSGAIDRVRPTSTATSAAWTANAPMEPLAIPPTEHAPVLRALLAMTAGLL